MFIDVWQYHVVVKREPTATSARYLRGRRRPFGRCGLQYYRRGERQQKVEQLGQWAGSGAERKTGVSTGGGDGVERGRAGTDRTRDKQRL